mgnify:FL=1
MSVVWEGLKMAGWIQLVFVRSTPQRSLSRAKRFAAKSVPAAHVPFGGIPGLLLFENSRSSSFPGPVSSWQPSACDKGGKLPLDQVSYPLPT